MTTSVKEREPDIERHRAPAPNEGESRFTRILFGPPDQPRWARPGLLVLLIATAVLYLWDLTNSGWANTYYSAAAQAGSQSWKALLFGSFDAGNAITVDKPPAALWVMGLSGKVLGFSQWSVLLPQALMGIGAVALLAATVRRCSGPGTGLLAGAVFALTPVATLIFRYDNPDALLVLLLVAAAYCTVRAIQSTGTRWLSAPTGWLALAGVAVGFAFLTKMGQAFLILPGLGLAYLIAATGGFWKRVGRLLIACAAVVVSGGWFVALVHLWPADSRPYIGGSDDNSLWQLAMDYNGFGRLFGGGNGGGPGGGGGFSGSTGITRLFGAQMGTEISWLLPAALIGLAAGLWLTRRAPRTDHTRAAFILWGGWLLITGLTFSYMSGTVHPYYTVALAPAIGALVALGVRELWSRRDHLAARLVLAIMTAGTGAWSFVLLDRTPDWQPWLRWTVLIGSILVAVALIIGTRHARRYTMVVATAGMLVGLGGAGAYALDTASQGHNGGNPTSGPGTGQTLGGMRTGGMPSGTAPSGAELPEGMSQNGSPDGDKSGRTAVSPGGGGPTSDASTNTELQTMLEQSGTRWTAATVGASTAGDLALNSGTSVMAIGGFTGGDNTPTLDQFQQYVADGQVRYFIAGNSMGGGPGGGSDNVGSQITAWVKEHYTAITVGGTTVYDLTQPTS
ncbi:glycosyltransferase family 39 protein [Nocardia mexicana]|uniref:4-amino-4-deoxy-L-arabinose transferase-like glycosyltransferase n=1 Tax=Nocardia mexicana TaxID=279262 RepID=A0A370HE79_9NOCA|nr:glycosyltransferase family 39 protein [Nocardia mexicana]RDI55312.1 4-amino-4-deoxy-L-arabinose transferase-like glycosyltransferase [Nocardia mexicana]